MSDHLSRPRGRSCSGEGCLGQAGPLLVQGLGLPASWVPPRAPAFPLLRHGLRRGTPVCKMGEKQPPTRLWGLGGIVRVRCSARWRTAGAQHCSLPSLLLASVSTSPLCTSCIVSYSVPGCPFVRISAPHS